jgi:hypothetical protein
VQAGKVRSVDVEAALLLRLEHKLDLPGLPHKRDLTRHQSYDMGRSRSATMSKRHPTRGRSTVSSTWPLGPRNASIRLVLASTGGSLVVDRRRHLGFLRGQVGHGPTVSSACGVAQGSLWFGPSAWQESEDSK